MNIQPLGSISISICLRNISLLYNINNFSDRWGIGNCPSLLKARSKDLVIFILLESFREGNVKVRLPAPLITILQTIVDFSQQNG